VRVNQVKKAQKDQGTCTCGIKIEKGMPYKWIAFRYGGKRFRCDSCSFRPSDLTESKMSTVYSAQEGLEDFMGSWDGTDIEELKSEIENMTSQVDEVIDEYREAAEAMQGGGTQHEERADELEGWKEEIDCCLDSEELDTDDDGKDIPIADDKVDDWRQGLVSLVEDTLGNCPF
jgi:hypothetical protein